MPLKPRFASGTLSLAAANRGPSSAMQSGRKPSGSRATTRSPLAVSEDDVVGPVELLGEPAEDARPVDLGPFALELVAQRVHEDLGVGVALEVVVALVRGARRFSSW